MTSGLDAFIEKTKLWKSSELPARTRKRSRGLSASEAGRGEWRAEAGRAPTTSAEPIATERRVSARRALARARAQGGHRQMSANSMALSTMPRGVSP